MKHLKAEQCEDGWHVVITETRFAKTKDEIHAIARHLGLRNDETAQSEVFIIAPSKDESS